MVKKIKFSSEISNTVFNSLKTWAEESNGNWNILICSGLALIIVGAIVMIVYKKKMGATDERTTQIDLKAMSIILFVVILCDIIFPKEYMWQIFFLFKYSFAFLASGIYLATQYRKDYI